MRFNQGKRSAILFLLSSSAVLAVRQSVGAVWSGVPGDYYSNAADWTPSGPPDAGEAEITNIPGYTSTTPCNLDFNYTGNYLLYDLIVEANQNGYDSAGSSVVFRQQNAAYNMNATTETIGGYSGQGVYSQGAANNTTGSMLLGGSYFGQYNLTGGVLSVSGTETIGATGTTGGAFYQSGGTQTLSSTAAGTGLILGGNNFSGIGTYTLVGGTLQTTNTYVSYGDGSSTSIGTFNQTGGTYNTSLLSIGVSPASNGSFYIAGGTATANTVYAGLSGNGAITATGGQLTIGNSSTVGRVWIGYGGGGGTLSLQQGTLNSVTTTPAMVVNGDVDLGNGSTGSVYQYAGSMQITSVLHVGYQPGISGAYYMSGGTLTAGYVADGLQGIGSIVFSGGTQTLNGLLVGEENGSSGTLTISGTAAMTCTPEEDIAYYGNGTINQQGGSNSTPTLYVGGAVFGGSSSVTGVYNLSGGALTVSGSTYVANNSTGTFNQSGGTHSTTNVYLANSAGLTGSYALSGTGVVNAALSEYVGYNGIGIFNQSGGTNNINGTLANGLYLSYGNGSAGTYILTGGNLNIASNLDIGVGGPGTFINTGGAISTTSFYVGINSPANSSYNMTGGSLTIAGGSQFSYEIVGYGSNGVFSQHGGTNTLGSAQQPVSLIIGDSAGVSGTYFLEQSVSTSKVIVTSNVDVGLVEYSNGTLDIAGGSMTIAGNLVVAAANAVGTVLISGGSLSAGTEIVGNGGTAAFIQGGGTNTTGTLELQATSYPFYNMTGGVLSVTSAVTGVGSIYETGGVATVASFSNFSGAVIVTNLSTGLDTFTLTQGGLHESAGQLIVAASTFAMNTSSRSTLTVPSLMIGPNGNGWSGTVDVGRNDLIIATGSLATVTSQLQSGYGNGSWNGPGIDSSFAANDSTHLTAVGVLLNDNGTGQAIYGSSNPFDGTLPSVDSILVKLTYYGDANLDGKVDGSDYSKIDNGYLNHLTGWSNGDFNYDGVIDGSDYTLIDNAHNMQGASLSAAIAGETAEITGSPAGASVPEPSGLIGLGLVTTGLLGRRRRDDRGRTR
jgi:hypothetical protein